MIETQRLLNNIAGAISDILENETGEKKGLALIVFDFGKPGISNYVSNAKRADMITALRETADRLEKNQDIPPVIGSMQ